MLPSLRVLALVALSWSGASQAALTTLSCPVSNHVQLEPQTTKELPAPSYQYQFVFDSVGGAVDAKETNFFGGSVSEEQWTGNASLTPSVVTIHFRGRFTLYTFQINRSTLVWTGLASMPGYFKRQMNGVCQISKLPPKKNKF